MQYDTKICAGTIIDGTGAPRIIGDIGIRNGKIVAVGDAPGDALVVLDAAGKIVSPGFIDIHTHYDAQILWDRGLSISSWHGVTTVVMGNCGFGIAPTHAADRPLIVQTLEKVEGMSVKALEQGMGDNWGFESFPEYLDCIESRGSAINVAVLIGHTPLRLFVMGREATERTATPDEVARMKAILREALDAGALGFATSKLSSHIGFEGRPVASRAANLDELLALAMAIPEAGHGIIQTTLGPGLFFDELETLARETGAPICWAALLAGFAFGKTDHREQWERSRALADKGLMITPQVSSRPLNFEFQFKEPFVLEGMSLFKPVSAANFEEKKRLYRDETFRSAFRDRFDNAWPALHRAFHLLAISQHDLEPALEERLLVEVAAQRGIHPVDLALDLSLASELETRFRMPLANYDDEQVGELLRDPGMVLGLSDAGAHASQLCDACQATDLLGRWVRTENKLSLEEAVRMLTSRPAQVFGIHGRGRIAEGMAADIVIFDPQTVGAGPLRRVHDQPGGADRLIADAIGIEAVLVNGEIIRQAGADRTNPTSLPGRLLRKGSPVSASR